MHTSARAIADHASPFLSDLISGAASTSAGAACQGYRLVVTGHSLGAGVAAIVGFMLRPRFPDLKVWAFSPPGGLLSPEVGSRAARQGSDMRRMHGSLTRVLARVLCWGVLSAAPTQNCPPRAKQASKAAAAFCTSIVTRKDMVGHAHVSVGPKLGTVRQRSALAQLPP